MNYRNIYLENIPLAEAQHALEMALREVGKYEPLVGEMLPLRLASGRITAEPVWARLSSPHFHAAAMDGYAVKATDTVHAAETRPLTLTFAQAVEVNTG